MRYHESEDLSFMRLISILGETVMADPTCKTKKPASEKRVAANRRNSAKSTGPKTKAGKEASRRNALLHGMCSRDDILPGELDRKVKAAYVKWSDQLRPEGEVEETLVMEAVRCSSKLTWLDSTFNAVVAQQAREAGEAFDLSERKAARREAKTLRNDPAETVKTLKTSISGCDWLIDHWKIVRDSLDGNWDESQINHALNLLGIDPTRPLNDGEESIREMLAATRDDCATPFMPEGVPVSAAEVRANVHAMIEITMTELARLRDDKPAVMHGELRREAEAAAMIPLDKAGSLWPRYQGINSSGLHRAIRELIKIRTLDDPKRPNDFRRSTAAPNEANETAQRSHDQRGYDERLRAETVDSEASATLEKEAETVRKEVRAKDRELRQAARTIEQLSEQLECREMMIKRMKGRGYAAPNEANETAQVAVPQESSVKTPSVVSQVLKVATILLAILAGVLSLGMGKLGAGKEGTNRPQRHGKHEEGRRNADARCETQDSRDGVEVWRGCFRRGVDAEHRL